MRQRHGPISLRGRSGVVELDERERDRAGRLLGYLRLDGQTVTLNETLLAEGFALPLTVGPNTAYADDFRAAARAAQLASRGIWSACDVADTPTVATDYPLGEVPSLRADGPAIRLLLGTARDEDGRHLRIGVEARGDDGLGEIVVRGDRDDDPAFSATRVVPCAGLLACTDTWVARPAGAGSYQLNARVTAKNGQSADASVGLNVVGRWQSIAASAAQVRARAVESPPTETSSSVTPDPAGACPDGYPVKGLPADQSGERRFLLADDPGHGTARPERCFRDPDAATAAGYIR